MAFAQPSMARLESPLDHVLMAKSPGHMWRKTYLREWRLFRQRSLESVAEKMEITHGQLSKIERRLHPYSQKILEVAAAEYDCTVQDLLTRAPTETPSIYEYWDKLNERQRRRALRLIETVRDDPD